MKKSSAKHFQQNFPHICNNPLNILDFSQTYKLSNNLILNLYNI